MTVGVNRKLSHFISKFEYHNLKTRHDDIVVINEQHFCDTILAYAGFSSAQQKKTKKRLAKLYDHNSPVRKVSKNPLLIFVYPVIPVNKYFNQN